jgi:Fe-S-cluster containining protein
MVTTDFDCQMCGACCVSRAWARGQDGLSFVDLTSTKDIKRMGKRLPVLTEPNFKSPTGLSMRVKGNPSSNQSRCVCLEGAVGRHVTCLSYTVRPDICRAFEPGSAECRLARQMVFGPGCEVRGCQRFYAHTHTKP